MTEAREPPPVPPGPGVQPPFVAAPIEGRSVRRWLGLGVAGGLLAACCGTGAVAVGGLAVTALPALNEQAQVAVQDYLAALQAEDWSEAYELRCEADQQAESLAEFTDRVSAGPGIEAYEVGSIDWRELDAAVLELPVELEFDDGTSERRTYPLEQDPATGTLQVCRHA